MTKRDADRIAAAMERHGLTVAGYRNYGGGSWSVDATDPQTGYAITIHTPEQWAERVKAQPKPPAKRGRKPLHGEAMGKGERVRLPDELKAKAIRIGGGLSEGVRLAVQAYDEGEAK